MTTLFLFPFVSSCHPTFCLLYFVMLSLSLSLVFQRRPLLSLNQRWVRKLICCLVLKLPSPVRGPSPAQAVVNFNHRWSWVIVRFQLSVRTVCICVCLCVHTWRTICDSPVCVLRYKISKCVCVGSELELGTFGASWLLWVFISVLNLKIGTTEKQIRRFTD